MIKELTEKYQEILKDNDLFIVSKVESVNHDPHPYTVGSKHIEHADENNGGQLDKQTIEEVECAASGCSLTYDEHKYDTVIFLQLKRNGTNIEAKKAFKSIEKELKTDNVDGIVMVETIEKFRINEK